MYFHKCNMSVWSRTLSSTWFNDNNILIDLYMFFLCSLIELYEYVHIYTYIPTCHNLPAWVPHGINQANNSIYLVPCQPKHHPSAACGEMSSHAQNGSSLWFSMVQWSYFASKQSKTNVHNLDPQEPMGLSWKLMDQSFPSGWSVSNTCGNQALIEGC